MYRLTISFATALLLGSLALAQPSDRVEIFGGYSYLSSDYSLLKAGGVNGWNASANVKVHRTFGLVADFSGFYTSLGIRGDGVIADTFKQSSYLAMFGPQASIRLHRISPFVHFLMGVAHLNPEADNGTVVGNGSLNSSNSFSYAAGGGLDFALGRHFAIRGQGDWLHTAFSSGDDQVHLLHTGARVSTGLVFRF